MNTARKDQPWGVRTTYRSGRSILVGPYRGRRAAVEALLTGDGRVRESTPVLIGLGLRDSTGPVRILRERWLTFGDDEVVPEPPNLDNVDVLDVVFSVGQGYQIDVQGVDLDLVQKFLVNLNGGGQLVFDRDEDPLAFTSVQNDSVLIFSEDFAGELLVSISLLDADDNSIGQFASYSFTNISFPEAVTTTSPNIDQLQIMGTRLVTGVDGVELLTDKGTRTYYDPGGPNAGNNPGTANIFVWTDSQILLGDTWFTDNTPVVAQYIYFVRTDNSISGYEDVNLAIVAAGGASDITSVTFNPHTADHSFQLNLNGSGLGAADVEEVKVLTTTGTLTFNSTDNPEVFIDQQAGVITLGSATLEGKTITGVMVAATPGGATLDSYNLPSQYVVPSGSLSSPQPGWIMFNGTNMSDMDRLDILVPGPGPAQWVTYYGPDHPSFATNPPQVAIMAWDSEYIVVQDHRFTTDNVGMSPVTEFRLIASSGAMYWDEVVNVSVLPGYSGPISAIHSVPTDRYGLAVLGTGLDLIDVLTVQGCGNGEYGDGSAQQISFARTEYAEGEPEVVSWTASQIIVNDPGAFSAFSGFVWMVQAGSAGEPLPYWFVNYPADNTPLLGVLGPDAYNAPFWYPIPSGIQNGNVYGYQIAEAQEDGLDRVEIDTVEQGTLVAYSPFSPNLASSTPGVTATYLGTGISVFDAPQFDTELTIVEARGYRGNGALYYTIEPGVNGANPTVIGGEVNDVIGVSGDDDSGVSDIQAMYPSDPVLAGFRLRLDVGEFEQQPFTFGAPTQYDHWQAHQELAGRVVEGVTPINALGSGLAAEYTGPALPFSIPSVLPMTMGPISFYTNDQDDGLAQFYTSGNWQANGVRVAIETTGDEPSLDITIPTALNSFSGAGAFIATALPGNYLGDAVLYDAQDVVVATGLLDFKWAEVATVTGGPLDGQSFAVQGKLLDGVDQLQVYWNNADYRYYYQPSGPNAFQNDPDLQIAQWNASGIQLTDPYIGSQYAGTTEIAQFTANAPSGLGQFFGSSDLIPVA